MPRIGDTHAGRWFRRFIWLGVAVNLAAAIPTLFMPEVMLRLNNLPAATPSMWPSFAALLLILLTAFYMPAGIDPDRYQANAWLAIVSRLAGVIYFLVIQSPEYRLLGVVDVVFFVPQLATWLMARRARHASAHGAREQIA